MTVPTFEQLMTPNTRDEFLSSELFVAQELGLPVTAWQPVSVAREILYINAQMLENQSVAITPIARGGLLDYAEGAWLTLLADQVYDVQRIESTFATGPIRLNNSLSTPHTFAAGDVRILNESTGKTYTSTTGGTLTGLGNLTLSYAADEPGSASNITSGDVLSLVVDIPGVTAAYVSALLGQDEETDPQLRERCRESNAKASPNGPADAYNYFAKTATRPDGTAIGVTRTNRVPSNGTVTVYVADADGSVTSPDVAYVQEFLNENCVPTGFTVVTVSAATLTVPFVATAILAPDASASTDELTTRVTDALNEYFSTVAVGGVKSADSTFQGLYLDTLITLARVAMGDNVLHVAISSPNSNVALLNNQVPTLGSVTITFST
jgi:uncharacterized phage protein gp47/JayE